jgi:hypothetical protein
MNQCEYGKYQEVKMYDVLKLKFPDIKQTEGKWDDWDYVDIKNKIKIELKSRRINSDKFHDTIIGSNKIYKGKLLKNYDVYYVFNFLDKILYYKLLNGDTFKQRFFNEKYHTFIPRHKLQDLDGI